MWWRSPASGSSPLSAGNLAVTQAVVNLLNEGIERAAGLETLANVPSMFRAARLVGDAIRRVYVKDGEAMQAQNVSFDVSMLLGGQIKGRNMRLFELYSAAISSRRRPIRPSFRSASINTASRSSTGSSGPTWPWRTG